MKKAPGVRPPNGGTTQARSTASVWGLTVMSGPDNPVVWSHSRDYGLLVGQPIRGRCRGEPRKSNTWSNLEKRSI